MSEDGESGMSPDQRRRAIEALWSDLDQLRQRHNVERLQRNQRPVQHKELAESIGVSSSTFGDWWNKRAVVPGWYEIEKLIRVLGGRPEELRPRWKQAQNAYHARLVMRDSAVPEATPTPDATLPSATTVAAPVVTPPVHEERRPATPQRRRVVLMALAAGLALAVVLAVVVTLVRPPAAPLASTPTTTPTGPSVWQATVVRTWSTSRKMDVGIRPYLDPRDVERTYPGYHTGDVVSVMCYRSDGRTVDDADTGEQSSVWYRLSDERELWLPGLYLQFGNRPGTQPPEGMPVCSA